ncbi:double-strand break repair protein MRE11-like [Saccoglossus kowalevskii]
MALLRQYCMGEKPIQIEFLSDQSVNFAANKFPVVNYEDPNYNVSIPVFSIHGNHDDPTGPNNSCALDLLSVVGLVNHFGKITSLEKIEISPILLQKGRTKLAMYGLGSVRDERLHRLFCHKKVSMLRPKEDKDDWFNMFVLHQNRSKHGQTNYIPEQFLDDFIDLVIWGHEHECRIDPEWNGLQNFFVSQPGSTIATSLSEGESKQKHVGLVRVRERAMKCSKIPLKTVRQFYTEDVVLCETSLNPEDFNITQIVEEFCVAKVEALLERAESDHTGNPRQPKLPLIRIRVDYSGGFEPFNICRFGQKFVDRVANPKDIILFHRRKAIEKKDFKSNIDKDELDSYLRPEALDTSRIEDLVKDYFKNADKDCQLSILSERGLSRAVQEFVDKDEKDAISELVTYQIQKAHDELLRRGVHYENIENELGKMKEERVQGQEEEEADEVINKVRAKKPYKPQTDDFSDEEMETREIDSDDSNTSATARGRGRGRGRARGRGSRGGTTTSRGRGSRGGKTKAPIIKAGNSIADAFSRSQQPKIQSRKSMKMYDDDDSDSNDPFDNIPLSTSKRKAANTSRFSSRGVQFSDSEDASDDDPFSMPSTGRSNKRNARSRNKPLF